jgi:hypothetical protein
MTPSTLSLFRNGIRLRVHGAHSFEALHRVACPHCWHWTAAWLAEPSGRGSCIVCEGRFRVHVGEA